MALHNLSIFTYLTQCQTELSLVLKTNLITQMLDEAKIKNGVKEVNIKTYVDVMM